MKANCWYGKRDLRVENVPDPKIINSQDIIVKVTSTAICGSELHLYNGFVPSINNSIGVGFGLDWVHYTHGALHCVPDMGPAGGCYTYDDTQSVNDFWVPVVMQWNFFLSRQWSVFGEPGLALRYESVPGGHAEKLDPQLYVGGRWHFADQMTLTLRLGYPTFSAGVSFM